MPDQAAKPTRPPAPPSPSHASEEASSADFSRASETSSPGGVLDDGGPTFDPEAAAGAPPVLHPDEVLPPEAEWEIETIESLLTTKGRVLHALIGVAEEDWRYTELDLAAIAPPLRRILNRYEPTKALAAHADPIVLAVAFGGYAIRSAEERRAALRDLEPADVEEIAPLADQPINAPPPAPTGSTGHMAPAAPPPPVPADVDPDELDWKVGPA